MLRKRVGFALAAIIAIGACESGKNLSSPDGGTIKPPVGLPVGHTATLTGNQQPVQGSERDTVINTVQAMSSADRASFGGDNNIAIGAGTTVRVVSSGTNAQGTPTFTNPLKDISVTSVKPLGLCPDGKTLITVGTGDLGEIYDFSSSTRTLLVNQQEQMTKFNLTSASCSPDGNMIAFSDSARNAFVLPISAATFKAFKDTVSKTGAATIMSWSRDGNFFAVGGQTQGTNGNAVQYYSKAGGYVPQYFPVFGHRGAISSLDWSGKWIVSASEGDSLVKVWDSNSLPTNDVRLKCSVGAFRSPPTAVASSPDGKLVAVGTRSGHLRIFELGQLCNLVYASDNALHNGAVLAMRFSSDNLGLTTVGADGKIIIIKRMPRP